MALEFVKEKVGATALNLAVKQQEQLAYFTQSSIQEDVTTKQLTAWSERKYATNDMFLNYVKNVFRTDNFLAFYKFFRNPIASSELIQDRIKIPLSRVFFSEDSFFKYTVRGEVHHSIDELNSDKFDEKLFNALLFRHNDIIVTGLKDINTPFREVVSIKNVVSIDSSDDVIHRIAYTAILPINEVSTKGVLYIDSVQYIFYYGDALEFSIVVSHDLGETPADYIAKDAFSDMDAVRKSMFSYVREKMEEYVFLKTLQRMTEPNGVIPITTTLKTKQNTNGKDTKGQTQGEPMASNSISGQKADTGAEIQSSNSLAQPGTIIEVDRKMKDDGSIDMEAVKNFLNFFHMPVEPLRYLEDRIEKIEQGLIVSLLGDFSEGNESAKNQLQVSKGYVSKQDRLRTLSIEMSRIRNLSDFKFLALQYGRDNINVDCFYGSDFFLESQEQLFNLFEKSPNPIERKNVLIKSSRNKNRFNKDKMQRDIILYHIQPYCSDKDFDKAVENKSVRPEIFDYYTRFNYWVGLFEAQYGDIVVFWDSLNGSDSENIVIINGLIADIITESNKTEVMEDDSSSKNAQAELRGSVGGITGIVAMLSALGQGQIQNSSQVVKILTELYGLTEESAQVIAESNSVDAEKISEDDNNN